MIDIRPFAGLGAADHGWLDARHHFSFAGYHDPARMGFGPLRVWNDDTIQPGGGFPFHPHRDMEIVTYVREGAISHRDSLGHEGRTAAGDVQVMSAGTGIRHAEFNAEPVATRLFQIWIEPRRTGEAPSWGTRSFPKDARGGRFAVLASGDPADADALPIRADAKVAGATLKAGETVRYELGRRRAYLVPSGTIAIGDRRAGPRDGVAIEGEEAIALTAVDDAEVVLVELG